MTYKSKRMLAILVVNIALAVGYVIYALSAAAPAEDNLQAWAIALLVLIGACIVVVIIVQIVFNVAVSIGITVKEANCDDKEAERLIESTMQDDEMDRLIMTKANNALLTAIGLGFVAALVVLAFGLPAVLSLHLFFGSALIGELVAGVMNIYFYEAGVSHA